jgi:hypothetical protein
MNYSHLLLPAPSLKDPVDRLQQVATFAVSAISGNENRCCQHHAAPKLRTTNFNTSTRILKIKDHSFFFSLTILFACRPRDMSKFCSLNKANHMDCKVPVKIIYHRLLSFMAKLKIFQHKFESVYR